MAQYSSYDYRAPKSAFTYSVLLCSTEDSITATVFVKVGDLPDVRIAPQNKQLNAKGACTILNRFFTRYLEQQAQDRIVKPLRVWED